VLSRFKTRKKNVGEGACIDDTQTLPVHTAPARSSGYKLLDHLPEGWQLAYEYPPYDPSSPIVEAFHVSTRQIRALFGGNRAGKSEAGGSELVNMARRFPNELFWACSISQDFTKIASAKIFKYLSPNEIDRTAWFNSARRIPSYCRLKNGAEIEFKTYKSGVESFAGASVKGIWLDEDPALGVLDGESIFVECLQRGIDCKGRIWITATPVLGRNWMYDRIYRKGADMDEFHRENPNIDHWTISLLDNKFIGDEEKANAKRNLTVDEIGRRFYGVFTTLSGAVFKEWDPEIHVLEPFPKIPSTWRRIRSIDLGYEHPFCCLWGALSPDGVVYVYAEYYQRRLLIRDHAAAIKAIDEDWTLLTERDRDYVEIETSVCDHDRQERAELEAEGIYSMPAEKSVDIGVQVCNRAFKQRKVFIAPSCYWLRKELSTYHYRQTGQAGKEIIDKVDDHAVDPFRYMLMYFLGHGEVDYEVITE
jgi:hypothetical protein